MPGRPPKPTAIHVLQGTAQKCRMAKRKGELALSGNIPEPPAFLSGESLAEWARLVSLSQYAKALTEADYPTLAVYCHLFGEFERSCQPGGEPMNTTRMMLFMSVAGKLGMNPSDRVKVHAPVEEKPSNKFAKLGS